MFDIPSVSSWGSLHPLIVHFPIALLFVTPFFLLVGLIGKHKRSNMYFTSVILMTIGTVCLFIAASTGHAAAHEVTNKTPEIKEAIRNHEHLAELTRNIFAGLTLIYLAYYYLPILLKKDFKPIISNIIMVVFLVLYALSLVIMANAANLGGELVHTLGVKGVI